MITVMEKTEYLIITFRKSLLFCHDDELDLLPLVDLYIGIRKLINPLFPRDIHTHRVLENEETKTVDICVC